MGPHDDTPTLTDEQLKFCYEYTIKRNITNFIQDSRPQLEFCLQLSSGKRISPQMLKEMKRYIARDIANALVNGACFRPPLFEKDDIQMFVDALNYALTPPKQ